MKRVALAVALALAFPAVALSAPSTPAEADRHDPDNVTAISVYMETLVEGSRKLAAKDTTAAIDQFKKAIALAPKHPLGHLWLGAAYLAADNLAEAEAAFTAAAARRDPKDPRIQARALFAVADVLERQKKWPEAKAAWQAYAEHAKKLGDAGVHPESAAARLEVIEKTLEREKAYAAVRERIAAERNDAGSKK